MDNMVPDPSPALPPSIPEIQAQIDHLEAAHRAKNFPLSGRIIHLCHHLPVEITRVLPRPTAPSDGTHSIEGSPRLDGDGFNSARGSFSASATAGVLSPPRIPEFKEPDSVSRVTEDLSWKLASRRGHTAMISGMRSLSSTHEQVVVAWTGDIMQEWTDQQDLPKPQEKKQAPVSTGRAPGTLTPKKMPALQRTYSVAGTAPGEDTPSQGDMQAAAPPIQQGKVDDGRPSIPSSNQHAVYLPELTTKEKQGLEIELDKFSSYEVEKEGDGKMSYVPVFVPREEARGHYEGYCKTTLWPLFHYLLWQDSPVPTPSPDPMWIHYQAVNKRFAERVAQIYKPGDLIVVHDYHLLLVPKMIREMLGQLSPEHNPLEEKVVMPESTAQATLAEDAREPQTADGKPTSPGKLGNLGGEPREQGEIAIGMFIHTPWPSSEIFRCLPKRKEILDGMLGANLVCFQTYSYSRHFTSTCIRVCGYESTAGGIDANGQVTAVSYCPIGVDAQRVMQDRDRAGVDPKISALRALYKDKKIIVGREKLDVAKGVYNKLQAFEKFLEIYPEWRGKVVLIQVTTPALSESPNLETKVAELVSHINNAYGTLDFVPVHHYHQAIDRDEYFGLLSVADLALITSLRDGMNTTSMEYVLCQDKTGKSPLVLSEFMGTASSFQAALQINPHDLLGVARAINKGLAMSKEEKENRHTLMLESVKSHTSHTWARTLLKQLLENVGLEHTAHQTPALDRAALAKAYKKANKRLLLFDYDGTLTPIVKVPSQAIPTERTRNAIAALAKDPKNVVWLISGRDGEFLDEHWGGIPNLGLSAEHGSFVKGPGATEWTNMTEHMDMSWMSEVEEIFRYYTERTSGSTIEVKKASITWHWRQCDPTFGEFQSKQCLDLLESNLTPRRPIEDEYHLLNSNFSIC
ncbi:hypothetical protein QFC24_006271 [Naganishia onofrii]|uniref:Uncharacterized protein n=1 Tax=Naganishia onofrii TaxID=1851511 RepID=A0ACC2X4W9_9TREE|nr:hypothetical protein QFC24_006271 [Naganishia onofrii]